MVKSRLLPALLAGLLLSIASLPDTARAVADAYYADKTIRMIIPLSPGGNTDTFGRLISQHLGRHIPGQPEVVAENVTGAGGLVGSNEFAENVEHDGTTLLASSGHLNLRAILGLRGLRLDLEPLEPLVAAPMGHVTVIAPRAGVEAPDDVLGAHGLTKGITDPIGVIESLVALELLGLDYRAVPGYGNRGDTRVAFERGELMINTQSTANFLARMRPLVETGDAMPLYAIGFTDEDGKPVRDPALPDMITVPELHEQLYGEMPSGPLWEAYRVAVQLVQNTRGSIWVHGDIPEEALVALHAGVEAMVDDPEFQAARADSLGAYGILRGDELDRVRRAMETISPDLLDELRTLLGERFGAEFDG
ncbi:hypothetical protein [Halomonas sp. C05BenzN]|uniref:hypothetical protein n=1 Tax=Halomonas sp. C05BenzN TaxID=3411041 RepID=UPI003B94BE5A